MAPLLAHKPGVDRAFERLYRRHAVDVYRYAFAVLRNQADAEDVTQTTFMNAYRALERGETPQTPHNWLIAIAHNVCRQRFRQAARRVQEVGLNDDVADHFVEPEDDNSPSPADIKRALSHLAFNQRAALVMRELEGRSYAEIADLLDLSVGAVETLIFRARRALREQLEVALTCGQAEQLLSRQLDGELTKPERGQLRGHLRECAACRRLARSQRAQRSALRALGAIPLPSSLASLFGGGASVGTAVAVKAVAAVVTAGVIGGVGYDVHHALVPPPAKHKTQTVVHQARPAAQASQVAVTRTPVVAAVVGPLQRQPRIAGHTPTSRRPEDAAPPAVEQQPDAPSEPVETAKPEAPKEKAQGKAKEHGHGKGHEPTQSEAPVPATDDAGTPPSQPDKPNKPDKPDKAEKSDNPNKPQSQDAPPATIPALPVTTPDGLTETSQKLGARNDPVRHLHP